MNRRLRTRLDLLCPDLRKKVAKPSIMHPGALRRQLSVGDPVLARDCRKSHSPLTKGVIMSRLGPGAYHRRTSLRLHLEASHRSTESLVRN